MQRTRLRDVELTGARRWIRGGGFLALLALAALGFFAYFAPAHSVEGGAWHSNFDDGGIFAPVVFFTFGTIAALLRTRGLGAGILTGVLAVPAAIASVVPALLVHLLREVQTGPGEALFAVAVIGLFFTGIAFAIAEPILYALQRRADERAARPSLPTARIYA